MSATEYYDHTTFPSQGAAGSSAAMRAELETIEAGFGKLPDLSGNGNKVVSVNPGGTALVASDTTGTGDVVRSTSPVLVTPALGTPSSGDATNMTNTVAPQTHAATSKATPVDADEIPLADSAASFGLKKLTWANLKAALKTFLDTLYAAKGANSDITSLTALASVNTGQLAGHRNAVHNGAGLVQQRAAITTTLTAALQYGVADRHLIGVTSGTSVSGSVGVLSNAGFSCGVGYGAIAASWTTGQFIHKHRIEAANTKRFNSKSVTVSGKLYQDTGGSRNFTVGIGKPTTTADTFGAVTNLGTSSAVAVPTGTVTAFSYTLALGSADASLGLEILITDNAANTVANKNYAVSDLQLEVGSVATSFEHRDIEVETAMCQRYLPSIYAEGANVQFGNGRCNTASETRYTIQFPVKTRVATSGITVPDSTKFNVGWTSNSGGGLGASAIYFIFGGNTCGLVGASVGGAPTGDGTDLSSNAAGAQILFTGAEL